MNHKNTKAKSKFSYAMRQGYCNVPGAREWCCTKPPDCTASGLDCCSDNFVPPDAPPYSNCPCDKCPCGKVVYPAPVIENFDFNKTLMLSKANIIKFLLIALLIYLIWYYFSKNK